VFERMRELGVLVGKGQGRYNRSVPFRFSST